MIISGESRLIETVNPRTSQAVRAVNREAVLRNIPHITVLEPIGCNHRGQLLFQASTADRAREMSHTAILANSAGHLARCPGLPPGGRWKVDAKWVL